MGEQEKGRKERAGATGSAKAGSADRRDKLAHAMRENLRKRKARARALEGEGGKDGEGEAGDEGRDDASGGASGRRRG